MSSSYVFYSVVFFFLVSTTALYLLRAYWIPLLPASIQDSAERFSFPSLGYHRLPTSNTFLTDAESGLSSSTFDLAGNIVGDDDRSLDAASKAAILRIMKKRRVPFDEARRLFIQDRFKKMGISEDGTPRDPKFVSFS